MEPWFEEYRARVIVYRVISLFLVLFPVVFFLLAWLLESKGLRITGIITTIVAIVFALPLLFSCNKYRRYNGHLIVFHIGPIKNYLIIDGVLQSEGGPLQHNYYGELPDGTQVAVEFGSFGNVKFAVGDFNNHNIHFF